MNPPAKPRLETVLPRTQLADFLERLAAQVRSGEIAFPDGNVSIAGMKTLKISAKDAGGDLAVKVRLKFPRPEPAPRAAGLRRGAAHPAGDASETDQPGPAAPGTAPRPRYKGLKKRMKRDFKDIGASLAAGALPRPEILAAFLADSRLMTSYRGKGDEHYPQYLAAAAALEAAAASGDQEAMARAYRDLAACKKACHARYA